MQGSASGDDLAPIDELIERSAEAAEAYEKRAGSQHTCRLPAERGLPPISASAAELERYQQNQHTQGGFDPCSLLRAYHAPHDPASPANNQQETPANAATPAPHNTTNNTTRYATTTEPQNGND